MAKEDKGTSGKPDAERNASPETSETPRKSLSDLLSEWEEPEARGDGGKPVAAKAGESPDDGGEGPSDTDKILDRLSKLEQATIQRSYSTDMQSVTARLKGDLDVDDWIAEAWINRKADEDPRLQKIWENRGTKKAQFDEVVTTLAPEFQTYAKERIVKPAEEDSKGLKPDKDKGLAAAVRSAKEVSPSTGFDDVKWGGLSEPQFALKKAEVFRWMKQQALAEG